MQKSLGSTYFTKVFHFSYSFLFHLIVYNGPFVVISPSVCALVVLFLYALKWLSSLLFSKAETISCDNNSNFICMQRKLSRKMQQIFKKKVQTLSATKSAEDVSRSWKMTPSLNFFCQGKLLEKVNTISVP